MTTMVPPSPAVQLRRLDELVLAHDLFWTRHPTAVPSLPAFLHGYWERYVTNYTTKRRTIGEEPATLDAFAKEAAQGLSQLRATAIEHGIPVPDINTPAQPAKDPLVREIDRLTDQWFWLLNDVPYGYRLSKQNPRDAKLISEWLKIRYAVAQEFATLASNPQAPRHWTISPMESKH